MGNSDFRHIDQCEVYVYINHKRTFHVSHKYVIRQIILKIDMANLH
jgi:hypothetical protein